MDRWTITIRPGTDFRVSFRLFYEYDNGDRNPAPYAVYVFRAPGITKQLPETSPHQYLLELTADETAKMVDGPYVLDATDMHQAGNVERVLEGRIHVSAYRSDGVV